MDISKYLPVEALNKFYDDAISPPAKQVGKLGEDTVKTARLILAPLQLMAAAQDRFERMVKRIAERVPEDRRIEPPAEIVFPVLEQIQISDESSPLFAMFEEVLTKATDAEKQKAVHPAFPHIIKQLSRDEAWIIFRLRNGDFSVVDRLDYLPQLNQFTNRVVEQSELPTTELFAETQMELLFSHLHSLGLVEWPVTRQDPIMTNGQQTGVRRRSTMKLSELGKLFAKASIPDSGFERFAKK